MRVGDWIECLCDETTIGWLVRPSATLPQKLQDDIDVLDAANMGAILTELVGLDGPEPSDRSVEQIAMRLEDRAPQVEIEMMRLRLDRERIALAIRPLQLDRAHLAGPWD